MTSPRGVWAASYMHWEVANDQTIPGESRGKIGIGGPRAMRCLPGPGERAWG